MRRYIIFDTNCDCASSRVAKRADTKWKFGPRCPHCGEILGCMQAREIGSVMADGDLSALVVFGEQSEKKKENNCGNCGWWKLLPDDRRTIDYSMGECLWTEWEVPDVHPIALVWTDVLDIEGTDCPCHKPAIEQGDTT